MGSRPQTAKIAAQKARQQDQSKGSRSEAQYSDYYHCLGPLNRLHCLLLSHIPTGQVAVARTGRRAYEQKAQSRKTHLYEVGQKWARGQTTSQIARTGPYALGPRPHTTMGATRPALGAAPPAYPLPQPASPTPRPQIPPQARPPYTPPSLPYTPPPKRCPSPPTLYLTEILHSKPAIYPLILHMTFLILFPYMPLDPTTNSIRPS